MLRRRRCHQIATTDANFGVPHKTLAYCITAAVLIIPTYSSMICSMLINTSADGRTCLLFYAAVYVIRAQPVTSGSVLCNYYRYAWKKSPPRDKGRSHSSAIKSPVCAHGLPCTASSTADITWLLPVVLSCLQRQHQRPRKITDDAEFHRRPFLLLPQQSTLL